MLLEIKKYPDPILKKRAGEIKEITQEIKQLADDMIETMIKKDGVGLAGPQVGISKKIIAVQTENGPAVLINPRITKKWGKKILMEEGCLSLPDVWLKVKRAEGVEIEAVNLNNEKINIKTEGFLARIYQHETDHLRGILIIDKLNLWRKIKLKKKLKNRVIK